MRKYIYIIIVALFGFYAPADAMLFENGGLEARMIPTSGSALALHSGDLRLRDIKGYPLSGPYIREHNRVDVGLAQLLEMLGIEPRPRIRMWFNNRLYQPSAYGGAPFVIAANPAIRVEIDIAHPYAVSDRTSDYSIVINPDGASPKTLDMSMAKVNALSYEAGGLRASALEYAMREDEMLAPGPHVFRVTARSSGTVGLASMATEYATVEVMGGPLRGTGMPITYPSPYSISKDRTVTIQYGLSENANVDVYVVGAGGERIKRFAINSGDEGGRAGINKITWNGTTDQGYLAGNAIYVGTIVDRQEGKLLGKFKMTIVD
jgi:hypothetical protein